MGVRAPRVRAVIAVLIGLSASVTAASPAAADVGPPPPDYQGCTSRLKNSFYPLDCWINDPVVNQPTTSYDIRFRDGETVWVDAGGCVQTGGHGLTWKRYVDPQSDNGLYHGMINIPGAMAGMQQLWSVVGRTYNVNGGGFLMLGYQDDAYSDNGYYGHDDGTGDQCKNVGDAWVHLVIDHN